MQFIRSEIKEIMASQMEQVDDFGHFMQPGLQTEPVVVARQPLDIQVAVEVRET